MNGNDSYDYNEMMMMIMKILLMKYNVLNSYLQILFMITG